MGNPLLRIAQGIVPRTSHRPRRDPPIVGAAANPAFHSRTAGQPASALKPKFSGLLTGVASML
jgi:hypothetical protein